MGMKMVQLAPLKTLAFCIVCLLCLIIEGRLNKARK